jgi:NADH-quinone oxidoreductase subunit N
MLYGISLIAGVFHTAHLPTLAAELADKLPLPSEQAMVLALGGLMIMVGLAFKLSAVPFHFWCPDVFEGASAEVNAFLSVASKAAALALLVRVAVGFGGVPSSVPPSNAGATQVAAAALQGPSLALFAVGQEAIADPPRADAAQPAGAAASPDRASADRPAQSASGAIAALAPVREFMALLVAFIAVITCTFGNLAAYGQTNIKRLMAYSTIAHAGYMMLAVPPALALAGVDAESARQAIAALALYVGIYQFMNLGAFAIIAFLRNVMRSEEIADYAGLVRRSPGVVVCFSVILFSLVGIPPLAGFVGKFAVFAALVVGYEFTGSIYLIVLLVVGGINTAISLFYYLRVVKVMTIDPEPEHARPGSLSLASLPGTYIVVLTAPLILLFFSWDTLNNWTVAAASHLF